MSDIDCSYANYGGGSFGPAMSCTTSGTNDVGSESPKGDGKWGQSDLGGNVWEWVLDIFGNSGTCVDCANTTESPPESGNGRQNRGGGLGAGFSLEVNTINSGSASERNIEQGFRCARAP
jgi:formylglycine-generating enzyme required for sulfatase activity